MAGVRQGMDSVHIDLSISKDDVPFLLRDHDPRSLTAGLRQLGVWGVARCRPAMANRVSGFSKFSAIFLST